MDSLRVLLWWVVAIFIGATAATAMGGMTTQCVEGNGKVGSEMRNLPPFTQIQADGVFEIGVTCGRKQRVQITAETNLLPRIQMRVQNQTLVIGTDTSVCAKKELRIDIHVPRLERLSADGAVDAVVADIRSERFVLDLAGSGNATLAGQAGRLDARLTGAGDLYAAGLMTRHASVSLEGAGQATVHATQRLEATIEGTGDITVYGHPEKIIENISGVGEVLRR
ncbi:MAG: DUF2807 domain-containing protein [Desulfobacterales bacterium]|nr:DUF2807 domain-containing protein [Desulfobacterales bacterium]